MGTTTEPERRGNLRWAMLFAGVVAALWFVALPLLSQFDSGVGHNRAALAVICAAIVLTPFALVWFVAEAHLEWSPRDRLARGVVGWVLALGTLAMLVLASPFAVYVFIVSLDILLHG
ncbi:hypothetical protein N798_12980 [Knoellia flava TL1]|nr:hypothetical protein [Knoellia flava]KGN29643.1 hypothetical protein N798_12980 [Knoellia flava TL1]